MRSYRLLILASALSLAPQVQAQIAWRPIDPAELKMTSDPNAPGADAIILHREENYSDVRHSELVYVQVKVLTDKGRERANVEVPYGGIGEKVVQIDGRTIHNDGTVIPFDGKSYDKVIAGNKYFKYGVKTFALPQVEVGSVFEYRYSLDWSDFIGTQPDWIVQTNMYQREAWFHFAPIELSVGQSLLNARGQALNSVLWNSHLPPAVPAPAEDKKGEVDLKLTNVPAFVSEPYSPPEKQLMYSVRFFYGRQGTDVRAFWNDEGASWTSVADQFMAPNSTLVASAKQLAGEGTDEQKARNLYDAVEKFENVEFEMPAATPQDGNAKDSSGSTKGTPAFAAPKSASEVLTQKRGRPVDLNRTYVALARAAGLHADLMRVATRENWIFDPNMQNWGQLNAEIAVVTLADKLDFVDAGCKLAPFGTLDWPRTAVQGMLEANNGKVQFVATPPPDYKANKTQRTALLTLGPDGTLSGKITVLWFGQEALDIRQRALQQDDAARKDNLEKQLTGWLPAGSTAKLEIAQYWTDSSKPMAARFDVTVPNFVVSAGSGASARWVVPATLFQNHDGELLTANTRMLPVYFPYPYTEVDEMTVTPPAGAVVDSVPTAQTDSHDYGAYVLTTNSDGKTLKFHREFIMGGMVFQPNDYAGLKAFFEKARDGDKQVATLRQAAGPQ